MYSLRSIDLTDEELGTLPDPVAKLVRDFCVPTENGPTRTWPVPECGFNGMDISFFLNSAHTYEMIDGHQRHTDGVGNVGTGSHRDPRGYTAFEVDSADGSAVAVGTELLLPYQIANTGRMTQAISHGGGEHQEPLPMDNTCRMCIQDVGDSSPVKGEFHDIGCQCKESKICKGDCATRWFTPKVKLTMEQHRYVRFKLLTLRIALHLTDPVLLLPASFSFPGPTLKHKKQGRASLTSGRLLCA
jgi:hypothetical protein